MKCSRCGSEAPVGAIVCPRCGNKLRQTRELYTPTQAEKDPQEPFTVEEERPRREGCWRSLLVILIAATAIVAVLSLGAAGAYYGLQDRARTERQAAQQHYNLGVAHLDQEEYELAIAEFELVLRLDPQHPQAREMIAEARKRLETQPTPTPQLQKETGQVYFDELKAAYAKKDWSLVFALAEQLSTLDPNAHRSEVDQMLYEALYQSGQDLVQEERLEEAVRLFNRALAIKPDSAEAARAKQLATLYLSGRTYWNADWAKSLESWAALYKLDPAYKDVHTRLHDAHTNFGDVLAGNGDWCSAEEQYTQAQQVYANDAIAAKAQEAAQHCKSAAAGGNQAGFPVPPGAYVGKLVEQLDIDKQKMMIRGQVRNKNAQAVAGTRVQIKAFDWAVVATSDGQGNFSFDGLNNPVTYTLTLMDLPSMPFDVAGVFGKLARVEFQQGP